MKGKLCFVGFLVLIIAAGATIWRVQKSAVSDIQLQHNKLKLTLELKISNLKSEIKDLRSKNKDLLESRLPVHEGELEGLSLRLDLMELNGVAENNLFDTKLIGLKGDLQGLSSRLRALELQKEIVTEVAPVNGAVSQVKKTASLLNRKVEQKVKQEPKGEILSKNIGFPGIAGEIMSFVEFDDGSELRLFAAGDFSSAGGNSASNLAYWDGQMWQGLGVAFSDKYGDTAISDMEVFYDEHGSKLIVGGNFLKVGELSAENIASWDGMSWSTLAEGLPYRVESLLGLNGELYAGAAGPYRSSGSKNQVVGVACWDGRRWSQLGEKIHGSVTCLAGPSKQIAGMHLFAAGSFEKIGDVIYNNIAAWDGQSWQALGIGISGIIFDIASTDDGLYAAGSFDFADGFPVDGFARWDGASWNMVSVPADLSFKANSFDVLYEGFESGQLWDFKEKCFWPFLGEIG